MENYQLEELAIDSLWCLLQEQTTFFTNKVSLMYAIYSEILEIRKGQDPSLSDLAKKKLFDNILLKPFTQAKVGIDQANVYSTKDAYTVYEDGRLTFRGMARLYITMGMLNNIPYSYKTNNSTYYAVSSLVEKFNLQYTQYSEKSVFEIMCDFILARPRLQEGDEKMVANSFLASTEYEEFVHILNEACELYLSTLMVDFSQEIRRQKGDKVSQDIIYLIYRELTKQFSRRDFNSHQIISSNISQELLTKFETENA